MAETLSSGPFTDVQLDVRKVDGRLRPVIIKAANEKGKGTKESIEREGRILGKLQHASISQLYGINKSGALVLEYFEGIPLTQWIANPKFNSIRDRLALTIGIEVARILTYLHRDHEISDTELGPIVHGDLCPANILFSLSGKIKLIGFGSAQVEPRSGKGFLKAKPATIRYTSPD